MFHVELRQFPHNAHAFNLTEGQLRGTIVSPWVRNQIVELGDRKWVPERTKLTIYEGPELKPNELALSRGWTAAVRQGEDVTQRLLDDARVRMELAAAPAPSAAPDQFASELLALCARDAVSGYQAWRLASSWYPAWRASDRLVAAERAVRELLLAGLVELCRGSRTTTARNVVPPSELEPLLLAIETWAGGEEPTVFLRASSAGVALVEKSSGAGAA